jgi:hypothetical protein
MIDNEEYANSVYKKEKNQISRQSEPPIIKSDMCGYVNFLLKYDSSFPFYSKKIHVGESI